MTVRETRRTSGLAGTADGGHPRRGRILDVLAAVAFMAQPDLFSRLLAGGDARPAYLGSFLPGLLRPAAGAGLTGARMRRKGIRGNSLRIFPLSTVRS